MAFLCAYRARKTPFIISSTQNRCLGPTHCGSLHGLSYVILAAPKREVMLILKKKQWWSLHLILLPCRLNHCCRTQKARWSSSASLSIHESTLPATLQTSGRGSLGNSPKSGSPAGGHCWAARSTCRPTSTHCLSHLTGFFSEAEPAHLSNCLAFK